MSTIVNPPGGFQGKTEKEPLPLMDSNLYDNGWGRTRPTFATLRPDSPPGALLDSQFTVNVFHDEGWGRIRSICPPGGCTVSNHLTATTDTKWNRVLQEPTIHFQSNEQPGKELRMPQYVSNVVGHYVFGGQGGQNDAASMKNSQVDTDH